LSLLVVGSIAFDSIKTPYGSVENALGGSATYFSLAASLLTDVRLVGVVGEDFPEEFLRMFEAHDVDTRGLQVAAGKTFRWTGAYAGDMNEAETLAVELNVFGEFDPRIPEEYADSRFVFLANGSPSIQRAVREQAENAELVVCDTMNYWIETANDELKRLLGEVQGVVLNDQEARLLTGREVLVDSGRDIMDMGPEFVVIKKGEHGAILCWHEICIPVPGYPTGVVRDPTGAGDSFAGGLMGAIARADDLSLAGLKRALTYGTIIASVTVEGFGTSTLEKARTEDIEERLEEFREMLSL